MKIGIIGTGYVGLPTGAGLADLGNEVICIDKDDNKIKKLREGYSTIYEEGLDDLLKRNVKEGRLSFTTSMKEGVENADIVIIAVGTPLDPRTGEADLQYIYAAAEELSDHLNGYTLVATKSTVPVGTGEKIEAIIKKNNKNKDTDIVSLPEFLREGFAVKDFFYPDRIVVGADSERAFSLIRELYKPLADRTEILCVKRRSAEVIKYASNAFLAMKIHYINEMSDFCETVDADIAEVAKGMGLDNRIGNKFLNAGPGYGGSCFPKDTNAMAYMGRCAKVNLSLVEATIRGNDLRQTTMARRILNKCDDVKNCKIAVWGLAFKNGTDDIRQSPAMAIVEQLLQNGADLTVYDPKAMDNASSVLGTKVKYAQNALDAVKGADVLAILTEWKEFALVKTEDLQKLMRGKKIVDLRNMLRDRNLQEKGFDYCCVGRK